MSSYVSDWPPVPYDVAYKQFFEEFYAISDTPSAHEKYAAQFTPDATLIMASKKTQGTNGIIAMREGMWEKVASRSHKPTKVFPFGLNSDEVMLHGTVSYGLKAGGESTIEWAAHAHLTKIDGQVKMDFYQVYLDTGAQSK